MWTEQTVDDTTTAPLETTTEVRLPWGGSQSRCFVCGTRNPRGLHLRFETDGDGVVNALWRPVPECEGFAGIIHGGIVATVLDEAMSKAVASCGWPAYTCELKVRLRRHVRAGVPLTVRGWVVQKRKRRVQAEARLSRGSGEEYARAWGTFLEVTPEA